MNARPRGCDSAKVISVVETQTLRGRGTEDDLARIVTQYWSVEGQLLAERDPAKIDEVLGEVEA